LVSVGTGFRDWRLLPGGAEAALAEARSWLDGAAGNGFDALLADHPVLVLPTLLGSPPLLGGRGFQLNALTAPVSLAGLPALTLPVPAAAGVIASMQVIAATEERVLAFGRAIEAAQAG